MQRVRDLFLLLCAIAIVPAFLNPTDALAGGTLNYTVANEVNGYISPTNPCCGNTINVTSNGNVPVYVAWPYNWKPVITVVSQSNNVVDIKDVHATGNTLVLNQVPVIYFNDGTELALPSLQVFTKGNGACGPSNGQSFTSIPTTGLCTAGAPTTVAGAGPWTWSCLGVKSGTNAFCSATLAGGNVLNYTVANEVNGYISPANPCCKYSINVTSDGNVPVKMAYPHDWTPKITVLSQTNNIVQLQDTHGTGDIAVLNQVPIVYFTDNTALLLPSLQWETKTNGACGPSNGQSFVSQPTSGLCSAGTSTTVGGTGPWTWSCLGIEGGTNAACSASLEVPVNGLCGSANGAPAQTIPTTNLCAAGTATTVGGTGPWTWSCLGIDGGSNAACATVGSCMGYLTSNPASIILPPSVPQPQAQGDIVGVNIQDTSAATNPHIFTFGQVFKPGQVHPTDTLVARIYGTAYQVQLDTLSAWPDGSVKLGAVTLTLPSICNTSTLPVLLSEANGNDPVFNTTPVSLTDALFNLTASLNFTSGQYTGTQLINLETALKAALVNNPVYWLQGPLATQARVDVYLPNGPMHLTADVTAYSDGSVTADVQFNNDVTSVIAAQQYKNPGPLAPQVYQATITLNDQILNYSITQYQYQDWHVVMNTTGAPVLSMSTGAPLAINVQHDLAYLEHTGAILPYDQTTGVSNTVLERYAGFEQVSGFGSPLAVNNITQYMPETGGRADIGYTTTFNTVWFLTGDVRAEILALAQGDTAGAVPWNFKLVNGHFLTPGDSPTVWLDERSNTYTVAYQQPAPSSTGWTTDPAHQPNLSYIPYIMTGERWFLDRLNAEAAYSEIVTTPSTGEYETSGRLAGQLTNMPNAPNIYDILIAPGSQTRGAAWTMREVQEAGWIGNAGSFEQAYFAQAAIDNWNYIEALMPSLTQAQGQTVGWLPNGQGASCTPISGNGGSCVQPPWQQDYFTAVAVLGAEMGYPGALQYINWQKDGWLPGRFIGQGMNPFDGVAYYIQLWASANVANTTWAPVEAGTVAQGFSNGTKSVSANYDQLARGALNGVYMFYPQDTNLQQALSWAYQNMMGIDAATFQMDPTFNIVPLN